MSFDARTLYDLLPAFHRNRDLEAGGALQALIQVVAEQIGLLEEDLAQLYDDQFIETCADWVVPYIGDLVGYRQLHGVTPQIRSPRAEVADTLRLRSGKGTAATLEMLARDVTGWGAHVVEFQQGLATTQYVNHVRSTRSAFADLRKPEAPERLNGPFDPFAHTFEARRAGSGRGRYNIANLGIFLWRLQAFPVISAAAAQVDAKRFLFNPQSAPTALFSRSTPNESATATTAQNVAQPLTRYAFAAAKDQFYGPGKSVFIEGVPIDMIAVCDLSDARAGWAHAPTAGSVAVDPVLGRIAFGTAPGETPRVTYHYGLSVAVGGGGYDRLASLETLEPTSTVPGDKPTVKAALDVAGSGGTIEITDSGRYAETIAIGLTGKGAQLELRSSDQQAPFLALGGELLVSGADSTGVSLNGLWIAGGRVRVPAGADNGLRRLSLRHCTLTPGITRTVDGSPVEPDTPSLVIESGVIVEIDHCIVGGLRVAPGAEVTISNSVIDGSHDDGVAYAAPDGQGAGGPLTISDSTIVGKVHTVELREASNTIFASRLGQADGWLAPVWAERRRAGCTRFCYLPPGSRVPRPYRCRPTGEDSASIVPIFTSLRFGDPGYCQLSRRTSTEIREGSEDGSEMGVCRELNQPQRETNLRVRLDEYLRFGLEAALIFIT